MKSFIYMGNVFEPLRDFTEYEEAYQNLSMRTKNFKSIISITGYSYKTFFNAAQSASGYFDLYIINSSPLVTPGLKVLYVYDLNIPLLYPDIGYQSECCGKRIDITAKQKSKKAGPYICSLCMEPVTMTGKLKN